MRGAFRVGEVSDRTGDDLSRGRSGEPEELVDLVTRDVGDDAAELVAVIEPIRPTATAGEVGAVAFAVRTQAEGLDDLADPSGADQSPARVTQRTSKRSEKVTDQNVRLPRRPVSISPAGPTSCSPTCRDDHGKFSPFACSGCEAVSSWPSLGEPSRPMRCL